MASLRLRVSFENYDQLPEKYWILIDVNRMKVIQDVIDNIEGKFSVRCDKLVLADARLLEKESVDILRESDVIQVHVKRAKRKSKEENLVLTEQVQNGHNEEDEEERRSRKQAKRKKKELEETRIPQPQEVEEEPAVIKSHSQPVKDTEASESSSKQADIPTQLEASTEEAKTKRRRRKRKSQHKNATPVKEVPVVPPPNPYVYIPPSKDRKHIRFDSLEHEPSVTNGCEESPSIGFKDQQKETAKVTTNGRAAPVKPTPVKPTPVQSTTASQNGSPLNALLSLRSAVFSRNGQQDVVVSQQNKSSSTPVPPQYNNVPPPTAASSPQVSSQSNGANCVPDPTQFPIFSGPPRVGDVIAFKVLELSENYNPEVSEYYQGRISQMSANGDITIDLFGEGKVVKHSRGRFELIEHEEEDEEEQDEGMEELEYETTVTYKWSQLIEPRLIQP